MRVLTEESARFGEQVAVAVVEDASQVLSQLQMLDLILSDRDVSGPENRAGNRSAAAPEQSARAKRSESREQTGDTWSRCWRL